MVTHGLSHPSSGGGGNTPPPPPQQVGVTANFSLEQVGDSDYAVRVAFTPTDPDTTVKVGYYGTNQDEEDFYNEGNVSTADYDSGTAYTVGTIFNEASDGIFTVTLSGRDGEGARSSLLHVSTGTASLSTTVNVV
jgi:hypothetical protein